LREAIELFYFAYRAFTAEADQILDQSGLGRVHHRILYFVGRNPDLSVNDLLAILGVTKQALHAPLRALLDRKLVTHRPGEDRRVKRLRLTDAGLTLEARLTGVQLQHLARVFAATGAKAEREWKTVMRSLPGRSIPRRRIKRTGLPAG